MDTRISRRKVWLARALLVTLSIAVGLTASEIGLRLYKPRAVMNQQILSGLGLTDADQNWERSADLGWIIKSNSTFVHKSPAGEFETQIRTDDLGIRVPLDASAKSAAAADRTILFIGDSVTAAYEVQYEETFVSRVEKSLSQDGSRVRALNAGIRGYSTEQAMKRMNSLLGSGLGVTDVVYLYAFNDPFENMSLHFPKRLFTKPGAYLDDQGRLQFRVLDHDLGVLDSEAVFVVPGGGIGTLPVIGRPTSASSVAERIRLNEPRTILDQSYLYTLVRLVLDLYLVPKGSVAEVDAKYPYVKPDYVADAEGRYVPGFIDVSWESGSYPLRLLEKIVTQMKELTDARSVRFWVALPLTSPATQISFWKDSAVRTGVSLISPSPQSQQEWYARCGGTLTFRIDGHYSACGHAGQAEVLTQALSKQ